MSFPRENNYFQRQQPQSPQLCEEQNQASNKLNLLVYLFRCRRQEREGCQLHNSQHFMTFLVSTSIHEMEYGSYVNYVFFYIYQKHDCLRQHTYSTVDVIFCSVCIVCYELMLQWKPIHVAEKSSGSRQAGWTAHPPR